MKSEIKILRFMGIDKRSCRSGVPPAIEKLTPALHLKCFKTGLKVGKHEIKV